MRTIVFDVETGALPEAELAALLPPFDPAEVKTGNLKDPAKIAEKIAEAEANHRREFFDKAALDPLTGRVLAIGMIELETGEFSIISHPDEVWMLCEFWDVVRGDMGRINPLIGFNICNFDLPFLIRRSWKHHLSVPFGIRRGRYWSDQVMDLRDTWQLGDRMAKGSLDAISKHLGVGSKCVPVAAPLANGPMAGKPITGADFATLWQTDRKSAEAYLRNDVELTMKVAGVLGVVV